MWVAIDIQMKGRQFCLFKAIMLTSACVIMLSGVHMPSNTSLVCVGGVSKKNDYPCVWAHQWTHTNKHAVALTLCGCVMTHCKWCHGRSIVEIKMAVDGRDGRKCVMFFPLTAAEAFWFKRISGSAQGYSLPDTVQNNTPSPYFLEEPCALPPLFLLFPLTLTIGEVIRHECRGLWHEWMSSCNAPMTFCNSLLDLQKRLEGGKRQMEKKENT